MLGGKGPAMKVLGFVRRAPRVRRRGLLLALIVSLVLVGLTPPALTAELTGGAEGESSDSNTNPADKAVMVPEHPEGTSFNPNQIKDIKASNPGEKVNLIKPPTANNTGDARLSYPFDVPKGRADLQPELAVTYSSAGSNSWAGVGWDVTTPAITVETRWGVPRYDAALETETYLLNGEQLTPVAHRGELKPRSTGHEKVFHTRVEGRFDKIVRHGDDPKDYWWEVVDKNGTRSIYGGADATTLTDAAGNVATWALREVRDTHDNFMRYQHTKVSDGGTASSTVPGSNLYPTKITYTGHGTTEGKYSVTFIRDRERNEVRRGDVQIDARSGFKKVTADLLRRVEVKLGDQLIRAYELNYKQGAFAKTLLASVSQFGEDNKVFNTHTFDYFDDVRDGAGAYNAFAPSASWNIPDDALGVNIREGEASALSATSSLSAGAHLYTGYNPGAPVKHGSVGVKVGGSVGSTNGLVTLADVNGDSLPDKVFRKSGKVYYRANQSGPGGQPKFADTPVELTSLPGISRSTSLSGTVGIEGYAGVSAQLDLVGTTTTSDRYFTDVNGDQITDLVDDGNVLFGYLDANGQPAYSANSGNTPVPVGNGEVEGTIVGDQSAELARQKANSPLLDTVRRWVAPYDGTVRIDGAVKLVEDTSPARAAYELADGVRVTIQHKDAELWTQRIEATDYGTHTPAGVGEIAVTKGDALYFRTQSILDGQYDAVAWDPKISYLGVPASTDPNGLDNYVFQASKDFTMGGRSSEVKAPLNGTIKLTGDIVKRATTDDVTVVITRSGGEVFKKVLPAASAGTTPLDLSIAVNAGQTLSWRVRVDSAIDSSAITWAPKAHYTAAPSLESVVDDNGNPTIVINPPYDLDMYPVDVSAQPLQYYTVPTTGTLMAEPDLQYKPNFDNRNVTFTVKKRGGQVIAKKVIPFQFGAGMPPWMSRVTAPVTAGDQLYFEFSTLDTKTPALLNTQKVQVMLNSSTWTPVPSTLRAAAVQGAFAQSYRGWGAIGYRGDGARATQPLKQDELVVDQSFIDGIPDKPVESDVPEFQDNPTVTQPRITLFAPQPDKGRWGGEDENSWVAGDGVASSRMGLDTIDVLENDEIVGGQGAPRRGSSTQISGTLAAGPFGGTALIGTTGGDVDFVDLNGDQFPDVVGSKEIQYSDMKGGLGETRGTLGGRARESDTLAGNVSISAGSPARTLPNGLGLDTPNGNSSASTARVGAEMPSLGIGGSLGGGESDAKTELLDINGDGLPDKLYVNGDVALNLGYSFAAKEPWGSGPINDAQTRNLGVNLGFNLDNYGFAGGVSATLASSKTNATLLDVNGDGLTDRVFTDGANPVKVAINTGNGFTAKTTFKGSFADIAVDKNANVGGGIYFTFGVPVGAGFIVFNPGGDTSTGIGRAEVALRDVNGDGLADHVKSTNDGQLQVAENKTGRTNLLKTVTRPLGAKIDLDYKRTGNTYAQPDSHWALSKTTVTDGLVGDGADAQLTTYRYELGKYDRLEREFLGFGKVVTEQRNPGAGDSVYRTTTDEYRTDSPFTRGLLSRTTTADGSGHKFTETEHTYRLRDVATATVFPELVRTDQRFYEGGETAGKATYSEMEYDDYGNVVRWFDSGDQGTTDDIEVSLGYTSSKPDCLAKNLVGLAHIVKQRAAATGEITRHRESSVDCATGAVQQVREYLDDDTAAVTDLAYNPDGNLKSVTNPANADGQRFKLTYGYDDTVGVHVTSIEDSFGYTSSAAYNLKYGEAERTTDQNGQELRRTFDAAGRVKTVTGPYEIDSGKATISFEYHPEATVPYAVTKHVDRTHSGIRDDTIDTVTFTDGLQRVVQTKKDASVAATPGATPAAVMTVSGRTKYDFAGRAVEQYQPTTEPKGSGSTGNNTFNATYDSVAPTKESYDVLDRKTKTVLPDGVTTTTDYGFGPDRAGVTRFKTTVTDGNGKTGETYVDVRKLTTAVKQHNPAGGQPVIWTSYGYDTLKQLVKVTDDKSNVTTSEYDGLGRRTVLDNPDAGRTETRYDLAGNITAKITANLRASGGQISYDYDYNRLVKTDYPTFTGNDLTYEYGAPGASDRAAARITKITDAAGTVTRKYGPLGETTEETRTVTSIDGPDKSYTTKWAFDAFNRVLQLTYPDGEALKYDYDTGGLVNRAVGLKGASSYTYLARLDYDKFEQRVLQESGDGTKTTYTYDQEDRQLATLKSTLANGTAFQNLGYTYDKAGNITKRTNTAAASSALSLGGASTQTFAYDDLYRLTDATGEYTGKDANLNKYTLSVGYDSIHNATTKVQHHEVTGGAPVTPPTSGGNGGDGPIEPVEDPNNAPSVQDKTSYDYGYTYDTAGKPHAPSKVGPITHKYDANGNLIDTVNTAASSGKRRQYVWDEENRLVCNDDSATGAVAQTPASCADATVSYAYDADGNRVVKQGETTHIYPNRSYSERDGVGYKHVFIGENRLTTKTVKSVVPETEQSYFHTDHLGSSGFVTDGTGALTEHFEYFAFGETWVQENAGSGTGGPSGTPYKYTGKEQDEETGLYYHGARYYNPRTQLWASADPALPEYLDSDKLNGGIQNPANLASYTYSYNNPLKYTDPDGRNPLIPACIRVCPHIPDIVEHLTEPPEPEIMAPGPLGGLQEEESEAPLPKGPLPETGTPNSPGYDASGKRMPYANHRPSYGPGQVEQVWENAKNDKGEVWVPDKDGNPTKIEWQPGQPRRGVWDMGHLPGKEYWRLREDYLTKRITKEEFLRQYQDPNNYRVEDPSRNRSHVEEDHTPTRPQYNGGMV